MLPVLLLALTPISYGADFSSPPEPVPMCASCHDSSGTSTNRDFPNLAAQKSPYIVNQLNAFRDKSRDDPDAQTIMQPIAAHLTDDEIKVAADYFSAQPARPADAENPSLVVTGRMIFERGLPGQNIPACSACHGLDAGGRKSVPRLASQHATYLMKQLEWFRSGERANPTMQPIAEKLTDSEIEAVANFLEAK